ncbi:Internalin-I [Wickerhamomyces ciferrii]|uniref:Internalin-I n=1 Tax=Wickerhamomyces ciferrii (strain ATCC 14091 / BCRC 22168 / CBS 111 / JCM 3599 / NBRC 0793 / NRRL Y-1031 F-60-10) TaxID=1206466 RepID=K0KNA7_WICCF|nr:Internalin-I [Wickerhamomyces ciferrii]CCH42608.1 Internalin-I [Wickerhamomyces ciferrii]
MPRKRKLPVGRPRKYPVVKKPVPNKEVQSKRQTWARVFNLPFEIVSLIFKYAGPLDYWAYRVLREFERFRICLDPVYFVQTNVPSSCQLFRIPLDQEEENHTFKKFNDFVRNIKKHGKAFKYCDYRHVFIEMEVNDYNTAETLHRILDYLKSEHIECSLFIKSTGLPELSYSRNFFPWRFAEELKMEVLLYGQSQLILDPGLAKIIGNWVFESYPLTKRYKFLEYPAGLEIDDASIGSLSELLMNQKNVVYKKSVQNLKTLKVVEGYDFFRRCDGCIFKNLEILNLYACYSRRGNFNLNKVSFPKLKRLILKQCDLGKITDSSFPELKALIINEDLDFQRGKEKINHPFRLIILNNDFSSLETLEIRSLRIGQIFGNTYKESMRLLNIDSMLSDEGTFGDIPDLVSRCESFVLDASNMTQDVITDLFNDFYNVKKLKKMKIIDTLSDNLDYLSKKTFPSLEFLDLSLNKPEITELPKLKMPSLKVLVLLDSFVEIVNTQELISLEVIMFSSSKRETERTRYRDNFGDSWFNRENYMYLIDLRKVPDFSRTFNIDLRFHKAKEYSDSEHPPSYENMLIKTFL